MRKFTQAAGSERGIALVAALLALLVLSTLTTAFIFVSNTETSTTTNYKALTQGRYLAEAGVERTLHWMRYNYAALPETTYNTTKSPVQFNSASVVLSGRDGVTANYPNSSKQADFNLNTNLHGNESLKTTGLSGTYSTSATLLSFRNTPVLDATTTAATEMWQVTSEGSVTSPRGPAATVQVDAIVERRGDPVFNYGLFATGTGCAVIGLSSNAAGKIDSWDSSNGGTYNLTKQQTGGDIGANGGVEINGSFSVYGSLFTPMANQSTGPCDPSDPNALNELPDPTYGLNGAKIRLPEPLTFANPPASSDPAVTSSQVVGPLTCGTTITTCHKDPLNPSKRFILDPGNYGNLSLALGIGQSLVFTAGAYNVNSINMTSALSGVLEVGTGGPVRIHVGGKSPSPASPIVLNANTVNNKTQVPSNLSFAYDGTLPLQVNGATNLNVNNNAYGVIYAPNAAVAIPAGDWYGAMVMRTLSLQGAASFHYDAALRENFCLTLSWRVVSMSRNKY